MLIFVSQVTDGDSISTQSGPPTTLIGYNRNVGFSLDQLFATFSNMSPFIMHLLSIYSVLQNLHDKLGNDDAVIL